MPQGMLLQQGVRYPVKLAELQLKLPKMRVVHQQTCQMQQVILHTKLQSIWDGLNWTQQRLQ
jgi:hypothetical protein